MEYGYALITPKGYANGVIIKMLKDLIKEGFDSKLTTLLCIYDFNDVELNKLFEITNNKEFYDDLKKGISKSCITPIFVKGIDAVNKLKQIANNYNSENSFNLDKKIRYLDNIYVSNSEQESIEDFCQYIGIDDFSKIEDLLFNDKEQGQVISYNFKGLNDSKIK